MNNASIHIHPRRVWRNRPPRLDAIRCFNPHTHAGCDLKNKLFPMPTNQVSIHTPTQGVTIFANIREKLARFQSTHPRRVWLLPVIAVTLIKGFNPHTHAGCDISNLLYKDIPVEFQSTHPRRVWQIWRPPIYNPYNVSIHTPTQGVTYVTYRLMPSIEFQSTHPRRVWHCCTFAVLQVDSFNPHTHAGCDPISNNIL